MFAGDLKIHHYRQQSMLEEAWQESLGRPLKLVRQQQKENSPRERRMPMLWLRVRRMAFGQ